MGRDMAKEQVQPNGGVNGKSHPSVTAGPLAGIRLAQGFHQNHDRQGNREAYRRLCEYLMAHVEDIDRIIREGAKPADAQLVERMAMLAVWELRRHLLTDMMYDSGPLNLEGL